MEIEHSLKQYLSNGFKMLFGADVRPADLKLEPTSKDHSGDLTFVVFPYLRMTGKRPEETAEALGNFLMEHSRDLAGFNVVKGFLNLELSDSVWMDVLLSNPDPESFGRSSIGQGQTVLIEYSSPNTNKPLHLGHVRNNLLGYSLSEILKFAGYTVHKCNLINDRGIHICKSMLAWKRFGNGETPESSGIKGDHLVGKYYVAFDKQLREETAVLLGQIEAGDLTGIPAETAVKIQAILSRIANEPEEKQSGLKDDLKTLVSQETAVMKEAKEMLRKWEAGDPDTLNLWKTMNGWVYEGFEKTYRRMGVDFDKFYYESDTYLLGKDIVQDGLDRGVFTRDPDGSVWIDLTADGLDRKLVLRSDGTSVYITQDIGTAMLKYRDWKMDRSVYVVGNEQDYHFKVLKLILQKLGLPFAEGVYHLSYGMVDLPTGKMKSREGTEVDADELMQEMVDTSRSITEELGKTEGLTAAELTDLYEMIAMGALKYFLLKVDPQKRMLFNPAESIDFQGNTGPFIQYTHARIRSVLRNQPEKIYGYAGASLQPSEKELLKVLSKFPAVVETAAREYKPSEVAGYMFEIARAFNRLYHEVSILGEKDEHLKQNRLAMCYLTSGVLKNGMSLLGIRVPERM